MKQMPEHTANYSLCLLSSIRQYQNSCMPRLPYTASPASLLCFIVQGTGTMLLDKKRFDFEPLQLYAFTPEMDMELLPESENLDYYLLELDYYGGSAGPMDCTDMEKTLQLSPIALPLFSTGRIPIRKSKQISKRLQQLYDDSLKSPDAFWHHLQFQELLYLILQDQPEHQDEQTSLHGIQHAIDYMQAHFHEQINMKDLSALTGLTASSFSRLFKKTTGDSPSAYLIRLRMESAKHLLEQNEHRIKEISAAVGYEDEFYFSRIFHRTVGISPTFYIKRTRLKIAVASCTLFQDNLQSLGIKPVASINCCRYPGMNDAGYASLLAGHWEELAAAQPDLIIGDSYHQPFYSKLSEMAPSVILLHNQDWLANYRKMGELLGRHLEAEQTLAELALRIVAARRILSHSMENQTVSVMQVNHQYVQIQGAVNHPLNELIYHDLGLKPGKNVPLHTKMLSLPPEWLPPLESDYVFVLKKYDHSGIEAIYERMRKTDAWNSIRAVQNNQVKLIPEWIRMSWTPVGRTAIIDEILHLTGTDNHYFHKELR